MSDRSEDDELAGLTKAEAKLLDKPKKQRVKKKTKKKCGLRK